MNGGARRLRFVVVGSARSGTTLLQRLACELPGVAMPPETHLLSVHAPALLARRSLPLDEAALRAELADWLSLEQLRGVDVDVDAVVARLGGRCPSLAALLEAVVDVLCGPGHVLGEKTPGHLYWWAPLARAMPDLRFVAVVRDPRAVVASALQAPWVQSHRDSGWQERELHLALAQIWEHEQALVAELLETVGAPAVLVRYEDAVTDPGGTQDRLARHLGVDGAVAPERGWGPTLQVLPWETWKGSASGPVVTERVAAWRELLSHRCADEIAALCRDGMRRFGYDEDRPGPLARAWATGRLPRGARRRLRGLRAGQRTDQLAVRSLEL